MASLKPTSSTVVPVEVPRSKIYVSAEPDKPAVPKTGRFKTPISNVHFLLILKCGELYTREELECCNGKYRCCNCSRPIMGLIYLMPERYNPKTNEPTCSPVPYCRPGCIYREIQDMPNNGDMLTNFFLMYGHDVVCAPPRFMLFIPGGYTLEEYHKAMDNGVVLEKEEPHVHPFIAPILLSASVQKDHQLLPGVIEYIDEIRAAKKAAIGPTKMSGEPEHEIIPLQPKLLTQTKLSSIFTPEPASFGRPGIAGNPFMPDPS